MLCSHFRQMIQVKEHIAVSITLKQSQCLFRPVQQSHLVEAVVLSAAGVQQQLAPP